MLMISQRPPLQVVIHGLLAAEKIPISREAMPHRMAQKWKCFSEMATENPGGGLLVVVYVVDAPAQRSAVFFVFETSVAARVTVAHHTIKHITR